MPHIDLKKKVGPLPVWAWGTIAVIVLVIIYRRYETSAATSSTPTDTSLDGIDPVTGASYADEESAYDGSLAPTSGSTDQSSDNGDTTTTDPFEDFDNQLQEFLNTQQLLQQLMPQAPSTPSAPSTPAPTPATTPANPPNNTAAQVTGALISTGKLLASGAIFAPAGDRTTKNGYVTVGTGGGNYQYVPTSVAPKGDTIYHDVSGTQPVAGAKGLGNGLWAVPANFYSSLAGGVATGAAAAGNAVK